MVTINKMRFCWLIFTVLTTIFTVKAQESDKMRAQKLLDFVIAEQGDSVYAYLNDAARQQTTPDLFSSTYRQLEAQLGKYKSKGEWKTEITSGVTIYYCDIQFERYTLRFLTAFDADGRANSISFVNP